MKVIDIKPFVVDCFRTNWVFVKVYTDEGIDGVGEATLEYKEKALLGCLGVSYRERCEKLKKIHFVQEDGKKGHTKKYDE